MYGATGTFGNQFVIKNRKGTQYYSRMPDTSNVKASKRQKTGRENFAEAVAYARSVLENPDQLLPFKLKKNQSLYHAAIGYYRDTHKSDAPAKSSKASVPKLEELQLNPRQVRAVKYLYKREVLTNAIYKRLNEISKATATRDLQDLVNKKIIQSTGAKGVGAVYNLIGS